MKLVECYKMTPYPTGYSVIGIEITEFNYLVSIACDSIEDIAEVMKSLHSEDFDYARIYYNGVEIAMYELENFYCLWKQSNKSL